MLRCFIIDDELPAIQVLQRYIKRLPALTLIGYETNPMLGIDVIKREKPDVLFLDIQMDELSGIDVVKIIGTQTKVVFCTAYSDYAVMSYELEAMDYLMKPIEFGRFVKAVQRVQDVVTGHAKPIAAANADYIYIKMGQRGKLMKIELCDIDYVQGKNNYVGFYHGKHKTLAYLTMKELEERLPEHLFMRVHKSYIVSLQKIVQMENNELVLKSNVRIPMSANYKEVFLERMRSRLMSG